MEIEEISLEDYRRLARAQPRQRAKREEEEAQIALFKFLANVGGRYPLLVYVFHPANGGYRHKATAGRMKALGVKRGVWDVLAPFCNRAFVWGYPAKTFAGLAIEIKTADGVLSIEQDAWRDFLCSEGWACEVCREWTDAARLLVTWAGGEPGDVGL